MYVYALYIHNKKSILTTNRMNHVELEEKKKVKNQQEKFEVIYNEQSLLN